MHSRRRGVWKGKVEEQSMSHGVAYAEGSNIVERWNCRAGTPSESQSLCVLNASLVPPVDCRCE